MCKDHIFYVLTYLTTLHVYIWVLSCVCLEHKKITKNILHFGLAGKLSQTEKSFSLTIKYQGFKCKIVHTSFKPLTPISASTKQKESQKIKMMSVMNLDYIVNNNLLPKICDKNTLKMLWYIITLKYKIYLKWKHRKTI